MPRRPPHRCAPYILLSLMIAWGMLAWQSTFGMLPPTSPSQAPAVRWWDRTVVVERTVLITATPSPKPTAWPTPTWLPIPETPTPTPLPTAEVNGQGLTGAQAELAGGRER